MFQAGLRDLQNVGFQRVLLEPVRHLMAQNPEARWNWTIIVTAFAFSGDDKNQPLTLRMGI